jgi:hypothetical protein
LLFCEQIHKSKYIQNKEAEEAKDTTTINELYSVIKTLLTRVETLEEKYSTLHKYVGGIKKKINIQDWLKTNRTPKNDFNQWLTHIKLSQAHMNNVIKHDYLEGVTYLLQEFLPLDDVNTLPICGFNQKKGVLFVYQNEKWNPINAEQFLSILQHIDGELTRQFALWREKHKHRIDTDFTFFTDVVMENFNKLVGQKYTRERQISYIKSNIYQYLKCNLKNIVHYEFSF